MQSVSIAALALVLQGFAPFAFSAGSFIADPAAPLGFQPSITTSPTNNTPVINITAPSAGGISHNQFDTFNVGAEGVIHNNSLNGSETSVLDGGQLTANPNFSGTSATTILDEVTTANTSLIEGALEVYGDRATLIIANPNGITCNGCSFINSSNAALTTGTFRLDYDAGDISIDTTGNLSNVTVGASGLDANGGQADSDTLSIIAREIILNGGIDGSSRVDLISGASEYDFAAGVQDASGPQASVVEGAGVAPFANSFQIDAAALGTISAGKINIIGNEKGVGVRLRGDLDATAGSLVINSNGALTTAGDSAASENIQLTSSESGVDGVITNSGSLTATSSIMIDSAGNVINSGSITGMDSVSIAANNNDVTNDGALIKGSNIRILDANALSNASGEIAGIFKTAEYTATGDGVSRPGAAGGLANAIEQFDSVVSAVVDGSKITVTLIAEAADFLQLDVTTNDAGDSAADDQRISVSGTGTTRVITIAGTIEADDLFSAQLFGGITLAAATISSSGDDAITSYGDITIGESSALTNTGEISARRSLNFGTDVERIASLTNSGSLALLAGGVDINVFSAGVITNTGSAAIFAGENATLDSDSNILNTDQGYVEAQNNLNVTTSTDQSYSYSQLSGVQTHLLGTYVLNEESTLYAGGNVIVNTGGFYNWRGDAAFTVNSFPNTDPWVEQYRTGGGVCVFGSCSEYTKYSTRLRVDQTYDNTSTRANVLSGGDVVINADRVFNEFSSVQGAGDVTIIATSIENQSARTADGYDTQRLTRYSAGNSWVVGTTDGECLYENLPCSVGGSVSNEVVVSFTGHEGILRAGGTLTLTGTEVANEGSIKGNNVSIDADALRNGLAPGSNTGVDWASQVPVGFTINGLYTVNDSGSYLVTSRVTVIEPVVTQEDLLDQLDILWRPQEESVVAIEFSVGGALDLTATAEEALDEDVRDYEGLRFLGDPFVEARYIRDQALQLTGEAFVVDDTDDLSDQVSALYSNAASFANETDDVFLGEALSETQIASLTQPIVWYVNEEVLGEEVLVPRLYLPNPDMLEITPTGSIIASNDIDIDVDGDVTNTGLVRADGSIEIEAENLINETLTTDAVATTRSGQNVRFQTAGPTATIEGGSVSLNISSTEDGQGNLVNRGAAIRSTEGNVEIETSGDVINEALVVEQISDVQTDAVSAFFGQQDYARRSEFVGAAIESAGDINIDAEGRVQNIASDIVGEGNVVVDGRLGVEQTNLAEVYDTSAGLGYREQAVENRSASIGGGNVTIRSDEGDIVSIGSDISANEDVVLETIDGDIRLLADVQITESESLSFDGGGIAYSREQSANFIGSNVSGENITLRSGGDVVGRGAQITADNDVNLEAENLDFRAAEAEVESFSFGLGLSGDAYAEGAAAGAEVSVGLNVNQTRGTQSQLAGISAGNDLSIDVDNDATLIGVNVDAGNDIEVDFGGELEIAAQQDRSVSTGFGIQGTVGAQVSALPGATGPTASVAFGASNTESIDVTQTAFSAGGNIRISGEGNARIAGVEVTAGNNAELDVGDLTVETLSDRSTTTGFGVELSTPNQLARGRAPISVGVTNESTNQIDATAGIIAGNNLDIDSSGTVTNRGGRLSAEQELNIDAQNLINESITETAVAQTGDGAVNYQTLGSTATIEGGTVNLNISPESSDEGNLVNRGGAIRSRTGALEIQTTGDIVNEALIAEQVSDVEVGNLGRLLGRQTFTKRSDFIGGTIEGATDLTLDARGEVVNIASDIGAENDVTIIADEGFFQRNLAEAYTLEDSISLGGGSSSEGSSSVSASGGTFADFEANAEASVSGSQDLISGSFRQGVENRSATVTGSNVRITSRNGDVTSIGSDIASTGETLIEATEGDINLIADSIITESSSFALSAGGSAEASAGGSGLSYRADASAEGGLSLSGQSQQTANFLNSTVTGNNITLRAQNVRGVGAEVVADNNISVDAEEDVSFTAAQARVTNSSFEIGASQEVYAGAGTAEGALGTPDGEVGTRTNFGLDVTSGFTTSTSSSGLTAGGNLSVEAGGNASFIGTDLEANENITLDAGGDIRIEAIAEESSQTTVGISGSVGAEVGGTGLIPTGNIQAGGSTTDATRFRESNTSAGGNLTIRSGGNAELIGVNVDVGGNAEIEAEDVRIASAQDIVNTTGGSVGLAVVNPGDILNSDESPLSIGVELSDSRAVAERSQINVGGSLSVNARSGDAIIAGADGDIGGNVSLTAANGESGFQELRDEINTTSIGIDLNVSTALGGTGGGLAGIAEGTIEAIESGDGYALLGQIPGVQQVATLAAGIESGDITQIAAGISPIGGQVLSAIDQGAFEGQISANSRAQGGTGGTGAQAFLQNISGGANQPMTNPLGDVIEVSSASDIASGSDLLEVNGDIDARLGVEVTTTQSDTSKGNNFQIGGNLVQEGQTVSQIGSDINVDGDATLRGDQITIEAGVDRFSSQTTTSGVTVGFDVVNQDVKVGVDGSYSTEDETTVNSSSLTAGGNLTIEARDARIASANVEAENINVDAENLEVVTLQSTRDTLSYGGSVEVEVGITGDSGSGAVEAQGSESSSRSTGEQATLIARNNLTADVTDTLTLRSSQLGSEGTTTITADTIDARANTESADSFGFDVAVEVSANQQGEGQSGGSGSLDFSFDQSEQSGPASQSGIFGDNVNVNSRQVLLEDTQLSGNNVALDVQEDLTIRTTATEASNVNVGVEVSAGGQSSGSEGGGRGGASLGFELDVGDSTTFGQQAGINAGNLSLTTGGNTTLENGSINANDASIEIGGDLVSISQQTTNNRVTVDLDLDPAANEEASSSALTTGADLGFGFSAENSAQVDRPSGIQIRNNLDLDVGGNVALQASEITADSVNAMIGGDVATVSVGNSSRSLGANIGTDRFGFQNESSKSTTTAGITARSGDLNVTTNAQVGGTVAIAPSASSQVGGTVAIAPSSSAQVGGVVALEPSARVSQAPTNAQVGGTVAIALPASLEVAGSINTSASETSKAINPQVAFANNRAESLIRLVSQAPAAVRQQAIEQIARQLEESADLTSVPMLDGLNPTQKIEVLESTLDIASDEQQAVIEQAIELLRVDEIILGFNG